MKKTIVAVLLMAACMLAFSACSKGETRGKSAYEVALDNGFEGTEREWLDELKGKDGINGENGQNGTNGVSGQDGKDAPLSVRELYEASAFEGTLEEFIESKMTVRVTSELDNAAVRKNLLSSVSVTAGGETVGSGFIYKTDEEGNAYILTEYDVVYGEKPVDDIAVYLYGSENAEQAIPATYVCGTADYDVAILSVNNSEVLKNANAHAVTFSDSNYLSVGQKAYAIANVNGSINMTSGVVSVDSEIVTLVNTRTMESEYFRALCMDCLIGTRSGGGGIFDQNGDLIGMISGTLSSSDSTGIGYAYPANVVRFVAENLLYQHENFNKSVPKKCVLGISISEIDSKAVYDTHTGKTAVLSRVKVTDDSEEGTFAYGKLASGDILKKAVILRNGEEVEEEHLITRSYVVIDLMLTLREGDRLTLVVERSTGEGKSDFDVVFDITEEWMKDCK